MGFSPKRWISDSEKRRIKARLAGGGDETLPANWRDPAAGNAKRKR